MRRALAISELLRRGEALIPGDELPTRTLEVDLPKDYTFDALECVIVAARAEGYGLVEASRGDLLFAVRDDGTELAVPAEAKLAADNMGQPMVGLFQVHERQPSPRFPPPYAWPIEAANRLAVVESDVFVVHVIDGSAFVGREGAGVRLEALERRAGDTWIIARAGDKTYPLSPGLLQQVIYGFETIDSASAGMLTMVHAIAEADGENVEGDAPRGPDGVAIVETMDDAVKLVENREAAGDIGIVAMPSSLFDELNERRRTARQRDD
jgi:hypothetical protein